MGCTLPWERYDGVRMRSKIMESRAMARVAMGGLAVGLVALAGLALSSTISMERATAHVRDLNEISDRWGQVFQQTNLEGDAMRDYMRAGTASGRQPLASAVGRAEADFEWLQHHGVRTDTEAAASIRQTYTSYTEVLREIVRLGDQGDTAGAALQADMADFAASSLRKQIAAIVAAKRHETTEYLREEDRVNRQLRFAAVVAFLIDLGLLGLFTLVLLDNQRRVRRQAAKSQHDALHDALTGLGNRTLLAERMEYGVREAHRYGERLGLLLIDLNKFKEVNDTLGHHVGDLLLKQVAARLHATVREVDLVARLGGDEFAVLLPRVGSVSNATMVAERIHEALCAPVQLEGITLEVGASVGVAVYPVDSTDADQLLQHADVAMYVAKRGRVGVALYEPGLDDNSPAQLTVVSDLRRAIDRGELVLYYQPKADAGTGRICGVEALARWQHPDRGLLGPFEFIPVAEENGLIKPLTRYVLDAALGQCRQWLSAGLDMPVSVNVGAECLQSHEFPAEVAELLSRHAVPPHMLTLEITESGMITNAARAAAVLRGLGEVGVRLSIDDFGTGYSSISLLQSMPVHEMKLDRAFVTQMRTDVGNNAIVRALLDLGRNFDLQVVAEGIEDGDTWTELRSLGCDVIQGYFLSKPMPADQFQPWLDSHRAATSDTALEPAAPHGA
ncbi:MAG: hypothetical protein AUI14_07085 [Actinobacteria bacterium 13_2_20CM_2_71_6]|nr:MAG: hypothetical protein AUI14_07085 [Actinobacteria bacterium 13_2_20CM_2_71_6]